MSTTEKLLDKLVSRSSVERDSARNALLEHPTETIIALVPELEMRAKQLKSGDPLSHVFLGEFELLSMIPGENALNRSFHIVECAMKSGHTELVHRLIQYLLPRRNEIRQRHSYPLNRILAFFINHNKQAAIKDTLTLLSPVAERVTATYLDRLVRSGKATDALLLQTANRIIGNVDLKVAARSEESQNRTFYPPMPPNTDWLDA